MSFCNLSIEYLKEGYTQVDNTFFLDYLPDADPIYVKVYLYGLFLANAAANYDNNINTMSSALMLEDEKILEAFKYWQEKGIVTITSSTPPYTVLYNSVKVPLTKKFRYEIREYEDFVSKVYNQWPDFNIDTNKLVDFMTSQKFEPSAMILTISYYEEQKGKVSVPGILSMARGFVQKGLITTATLSPYLDKLEENKKQVEDIFGSFSSSKSMGSDYENKEMLFKWTNDYKFPIDSISIVRDACKKKGGKTRLLSLMEELYEANAITPIDVQKYIELENEKYQLATEVNDTLSVFARYENVVRFYINPWMALGFDSDTIRLIARFCFERSIKDLSRMDDLVKRFHRKGLLSTESINDYIQREIQIDKKIAEVLEVATSGEITAFISQTDRNLYKTFSTWGFDHEAIMVAAKYAVGTAFPMSYLSNRLAALKNQGIFDIAGINNFLSSQTSTSKKPRNDNDDVLGGLTREQINATLLDLETINIDDIEV